MRKLGTAALAYSAAVFLAQYLLPLSWMLYGAAFCAALGVLCLFLKGSRRLRALLITIPAALGLGWSWAYYSLNVLPAETLVGKTMTVNAVCADYPENFGSYSRVTLKLCGEDIPGTKTMAYDYSGVTDGLEPGDSITVTMTFKSAVDYHGKEIDTNISKGVFLTAYFKDAPEVHGKTASSWLYLPKRIANAMRESIDAIFPEDTAPFMRALITGDRTQLYAQSELYDDFGIAGLMHVVAISGLHLAFLVGFLQILLGKGRACALACCAAILIFVPMTGAGVPVLRAAFMQICVISAPLFRRENDTFTTLPAALGALLVINPMSAASVSLQLSFASVFGIVLIGEKIRRTITDVAWKWKWTDNKPVRKVLRVLIVTFSTSVSAMAFTLPLVAIHFGYAPLYSVLTNLLCMWAIELLFVAGFCLTAFGIFIPGIVVWFCVPLSWLARYVFAVTDFVAGLPMAAVFTSNYLYILWLAVTYLLFIIAIFLRGKEKFRPLLPLSLSVCCLCAVILATYYVNQNSAGRVTVLDVGQGQCISVIQKDSTILIDCGGTGQNAGDAASSFLLGQGRTRVDALILTHLHADHANGVIKLMARVDVKRLILPEDADDSDGLLDGILRAAKNSGTEVLYVSNTAQAGSGELELSIYAQDGGTGANERGLVVLASVGEFDMLVTGDADSDTEREFAFDYELPDIELYIAGHHGSKYSTSEALLSKLKPECAVVSVGYNNYGHPAAETLERLGRYCTELYRTDEDGNLNFWIK